MSNKPMFTKGPWHFDKWGQVIDANGDEVRLRGVTLAGVRDLTTKANTNLIAAAPELLKALQSTQLLLCSLGLESSDECQSNAATIAKALGEENV